MMLHVKIDGMAELQRSIRRLGNLPQSAVTQGVKKGAGMVLRAARVAAPIDTGELRKGIVIKRERRSAKGKSVYQVVFDAGKNDTFVKISKEGKRAYYPASQEYGFKKVSGGRVAGKYFMRNAATENDNLIKKTIVETMKKKIDKEWAKKNG